MLMPGLGFLYVGISTADSSFSLCDCGRRKTIQITSLTYSINKDCWYPAIFVQSPFRLNKKKKETKNISSFFPDKTCFFCLCISGTKEKDTGLYLDFSTWILWNILPWCSPHITILEICAVSFTSWDQACEVEISLLPEELCQPWGRCYFLLLLHNHSLPVWRKTTEALVKRRCKLAHRSGPVLDYNS